MIAEIIKAVVFIAKTSVYPRYWGKTLTKGKQIIITKIRSIGFPNDRQYIA